MFRYGFLPNSSIMFCNSPNAMLPLLIETSLFRTFYSQTFQPSECPKCAFSCCSPAFLDTRLFLPYLLTITPSPNSTPILSSFIHYLSERYLSFFKPLMVYSMIMPVLVHSPPLCSGLRMLDPWPFSNIIWFRYSLCQKLIALPYSFTFLFTPCFLKLFQAFC